MFDFVASPKVKMINVRLTPDVHVGFKVACELRGVSMSSFLHQTVVQTIREERERDPQEFKRRMSSGKTKIATFTDEVANPGRKRKTG